MQRLRDTLSICAGYTGRDALFYERNGNDGVVVFTDGPVNSSFVGDIKMIPEKCGLDSRR